MTRSIEHSSSSDSNVHGGPTSRPRGGYVLISPCRNEAVHARTTLDSVIGQTEPPALWVIVDDGSTDGTSEILADYARRVGFIRVIRRPDRGHRHVGPGVIESFYSGFETIDPNDFEYICKLDLDLDLPADYFARLIEHMQADPRLGTCSGKPYVRRKDGTLAAEPCGNELSVGMTKFYRTTCFGQIGGFQRLVMWDGIDCHSCRMLGWKTCAFDEPELRFIHLRPMGSSQVGILTGRMRHGFGQYVMGTSLVYVTVSALYRTTKRPFLIGGLALWLGYLRGMLTRVPRYDNAEFRKFLRRFQWNCLIRGKSRATQRLDERQASRWRPEPVVAATIGAS